MNSSYTNKSVLWLSFLLALLLLLLSNALSWLDDSFYNSLLSIVPYKWQLTILMIIIISLLFLVFYLRSFPPLIEETEKHSKLKVLKTNDTDFSVERKNIMTNLSPIEKSTLSTFLVENSKVVKLQYNSTVKVLIRNDILRCLTYHEMSPSEIMIEEWAWKWINENKDKLKTKI